MVQNCWFETLAFASAFLFTPAMIVISAFEVYKGSNIYYWNFSAPLTANDLIKAIIPIVIAGLGLIEHIMCACAFWDVCCCQGQTGAAYNAGPVTVMRPAPPMIRQINPSQCNTCPQPSSSMAVYNSNPSSFYAPRGATTYNYSCGMNSSPYSRQLGPNPAYGYFRG